MSFKLLVVLAALTLLAGMLGKRFGRGGQDRKPKGPPIEAARKCPACGVYVMAGARCDQADCPVA